MSSMETLCTLALITPAALACGLAETIKSELERGGFTVVRSNLAKLSAADAKWLYPTFSK